MKSSENSRKCGMECIAGDRMEFPAKKVGLIQRECFWIRWMVDVARMNRIRIGI